jgi:multidrug resistance efflux pump
MDSSRHPYRKFVFGAAAMAPDGQYYSLTGARHGRPVRLEPPEFELARLFDGSRDSAALREAAADLLRVEISPADLERFASDLANSDLLAPGQREPLPVPAQTDHESAMLGWAKGPKPIGIAPDVLAPSMVPGTLYGAGLPGSITGLWGTFRGVVAPPRVIIPTGPFLLLSGLLTWPLFGLLTLLVLLGAIGVATVAMVQHRVEMAEDLQRLMHPLPMFMALVGSIYLVNLLGELARAGAIRVLTKAEPVFGIVIGPLLVPMFHTDTGGAAEQAERGARLRIVAASMVGALVIYCLAVLLWFVGRNGYPLLRSAALALALMSALFVFVKINPLSKRDGYKWLVQWFEASDLREQALYAITGYQRPWNESRALSRSLIIVYGVLCLLYTVWLVIWILMIPGALLKQHYGPIAVVIALAAIAYSFYDTLRKSQVLRGNIGVGKVDLDLPPRMDWLIIGVLVAAALFPYHYEPSGSFTVLPNTKADIRALAVGDVREVLVKEGDLVKAGQVIVRLGDDAQRAAVAASRAALARAVANLALTKLGHKSEEIEQARQQVITATTKYEFSRREDKRLEQAFQRKAISEQDYQHAHATAEVDSQSLAEARKHAELIASPPRDEEVSALEADIARQQAELDYNLVSLANTAVKAPIAGRILSGSLRYAVGDYLDRGKQVASVEDTTQLLVEVRISENEIGEIAVGNKAYARPWGMPNQVYSGVVREIAPSAERNAENDKVVRVVMVIDQPDGRLRPEMTGYAKISAATYPAIVAFTGPIVRFVMVEVWSWLP